MKLRLFHQLFLLVAATALFTALAMAGVQAWNLRRGFNDYLSARDTERLEATAQKAAVQIAAAGGPVSLRNGTVTLHSLLGEDERPEPPPPPRAEPPPRPFGPPPPDGRDHERAWPSDPNGPEPRPGRRPPPEEFSRRLALHDADGTLIAGPAPPRPGQRPTALVRPVVVAGSTVAILSLNPRAPSPSGVDARFLHSQYVSTLILVASLLVLAAAVAWSLARLGSRRLESIQTATRAIARGDFSVRLAGGGSDEVSETKLNINTMAAALQRLESARRRWLAEISHELRTPLTVMRGELEALRDGIRPINAGAIQSLEEEALRLGRLVEDLHFVAVSDLSGTPCRFESTDAVVLCSQAVERVVRTVRNDTLIIELDSGGLKALPVVWDATRIEQLLANLLTNSIRYTTTPGRVRLRLQRRLAGLDIYVEDSAPGVPHEHQKQLFEPLYRLDTARSRDSGGSGLGLAICEAIVRAHHGRIRAEDSDLGGLRIHIELPLDARRA